LKPVEAIFAWWRMSPGRASASAYSPFENSRRSTTPAQNGSIPPACVHRGPSAVAPLSLLAGCYIAACSILWVGWTVLLPGSVTPFGGGPHHGLANLYFQFGKYFYGCAPILVGWVVALAAVCQRVNAVWPLTGLLLVAWMGAAARIQASRIDIPRGLGHIRMSFVFWPSAPNAHDDLVHALTILSLAVLPYLLWRIQLARSTVS
jgi:hypothetical protein